MDARIRALPAADGGNPRNEWDIVRREDDYYIFPFSEDGDQNYHFHLTVRLENDSDETIPVKFVVDWGDEEYQSSRNYLLLCAGDHDWKYIKTEIKGAEIIGTGDVPPGTSYLTLHPRYAHERLIRLLNRLPDDIFTKTVLGQTRMRRDIPALCAGSGDKRTVAFYSRVHPYESISSFMMEGMLEWLSAKSGESKKVLSENRFVFIPMPNPDGVADGANKLTHGGLNFEVNFRQSAEPEAAAMKNFFFDIKPDVIFDIHGWCNPWDNMWTNNGPIGKGIHKILSDNEKLFFKPTEILYRKYPWGSPNHACSYFADLLGCCVLCSSWDHVGRTADDLYAMGAAILKATADVVSEVKEITPF